MLTEKLALAHELSTLRPEIEHLRSQASSHQATVAEKLALQRQVSTLQVELETEKRASHRAITKGERGSAKEAKLEEQVEDLQAQVSKERRAREQAEKEAKRTVADIEAKKSVLETRLEGVQGKLRSTKNRLSEVQTQLQKVEADMAAASADTSRNTRKRITQIGGDSEIGTPGVAITKGKRTGARVGKMTIAPGKSDFSTTPLLPNSWKFSTEHTIETPVKGRPEPSVTVKVQPTLATIDDTTSQDFTTLDTSLEPPKSANPIPIILPQVEERPDSDITITESSKAINTAQRLKKEEAEPKKKKRRLLVGATGKTLFDDDDAEPKKNAQDVKSFRRVRGAMPTETGKFGQFSPLKKDRKALPGR
jgi:hypothetical protein